MKFITQNWLKWHRDWMCFLKAMQLLYSFFSTDYTDRLWCSQNAFNRMFDEINDNKDIQETDLFFAPYYNDVDIIIWNPGHHVDFESGESGLGAISEQYSHQNLCPLTQPIVDRLWSTEGGTILCFCFDSMTTQPRPQRWELLAQWWTKNKGKYSCHIACGKIM